MPQRLGKKFWFISIVVFTIGVFLMDNMDSKIHVSRKNSSIVQINETTFEEIVASVEGTMCVLFYMPESPWYTKMENNLETVKHGKYKNIPMYKLNVEKYPEPYFNQNLSGTPVVVFYRDGKETARAMGKVSSRNINHILKKII